MEWQEVLKNRSQIFVFDKKIPDKTIIEEILNEVHMHVPVKQNNFYYSLEVFNNSDPELRKNIYKTTWAGKRYNPQVLAPWLVVFKENHTLVNENKNYHRERIDANMQIGMSAMFIALSAAAKGLGAGFCQCLYEQDTLKELIGDEVVLLMGLGYKSKKDNYFCPIDQIVKPVPVKNIPKIDRENYLIWM